MRMSLSPNLDVRFQITFPGQRLQPKLAYFRTKTDRLKLTL